MARKRHKPDRVDFAFGHESIPARTELEIFPCDNVLWGRCLFESLLSKPDGWTFPEEAR